MNITHKILFIKKIFSYLNNDKVKVDFPAPVRPTIPTFSPPFTVKLKFFSTKSNPGRYRTL